MTKAEHYYLYITKNMALKFNEKEDNKKEAWLIRNVFFSMTNKPIYLIVVQNNICTTAQSDAAVAMVSACQTSAKCVHVIRTVADVIRRTWSEEAFVVPLSKLSKRKNP